MPGVPGYGCVVAWNSNPLHAAANHVRVVACVILEGTEFSASLVRKATSSFAQYVPDSYSPDVDAQWDDVAGCTTDMVTNLTASECGWASRDAARMYSFATERFHGWYSCASGTRWARAHKKHRTRILQRVQTCQAGSQIPIAMVESTALDSIYVCFFCVLVVRF